MRGRGRDTIENQDFELIEKKDMSHEPRSGSAPFESLSLRRHVLAARSAPAARADAGGRSSSCAAARMSDMGLYDWDRIRAEYTVWRAGVKELYLEAVEKATPYATMAAEKATVYATMAAEKATPYANQAMAAVQPYLDKAMAAVKGA